jgi:RNA polymerase sigma factor (sigma-70 family)
MAARAIANELLADYLTHWHSLASRLQRRVGSRDLAEDAMQETYIRLCDMGGAAVQDRQAMILRIAANIAIDLVRRERRHTERTISDDEALNAVADTAPSAETCLIDRQSLEALARALAALPPKPRTALLLARCHGWTHARIAARLGVSESMVAKYLVQALCRCRDACDRV